MGLEAGREIFAVPGSPLDPRCRGSNDLIRQGAHLTESIADVLEHLPEAPRQEPIFAPRPAFDLPEAAPDSVELAGEAGQVVELLGATPVPVDEVMRRCHLSPSAVQAILLDLELAGRVEMLPGNRVALAGRR
jgi:DNA processing protein